MKADGQEMEKLQQHLIKTIIYSGREGNQHRKGLVIIMTPTVKKVILNGNHFTKE